MSTSLPELGVPGTNTPRMVPGVGLADLGVSTTPVPIYTYKDLDISFSTSLSQVMFYPPFFGRLIPPVPGLDNSLLLMTPQPINPDGNGTFACLGNVQATYVLTNLPPGVTISGNWEDGSWRFVGIPVAMVWCHPGSDGTALAQPTSYEKIWSLTEHGWTIWRPVPPSGYVAMGMVSTWDGKGYPPPLNTVSCVRRDLVSKATESQWRWADQGSHSSDKCTLWGISPTTPATGEINFGPGTFVGAGYYGPPQGDITPVSFRLAAPDTEPATTPTPPQLSEPGTAPPYGADSVQAGTELPFFAVADDGFDSMVEQMLSSPTYKLVRTDRYCLLPPVVWNQSTIQQSGGVSVTAGYNEAETKDFSETTGIDFSVQFGNGESPVSFTMYLSRSFTVSDSISQGFNFDINESFTVVADPKTTVAAYWVASSFQLERADGTTVGNPVTAGLDLTIVWVQYPPPEGTVALTV